MDSKEKQHRQLLALKREAVRLAQADVATWTYEDEAAKKRATLYKAKQWLTVLLRESDPRLSEWKTNRDLALLRGEFSRTVE